MLLYPEARAALKRAARDRRLSAPHLRYATSAFERLWAQVAQIGVTTSLARRAGTLADEQDLRGYDAVHLASALLWQEALSEPVTLATFDRQLWDAAPGVGLAVWPEQL